MSPHSYLVTGCEKEVATAGSGPVARIEKWRVASDTSKVCLSGKAEKWLIMLWEYATHHWSQHRGWQWFESVDRTRSWDKMNMSNKGRSINGHCLGKAAIEIMGGGHRFV